MFKLKHPFLYHVTGNRNMCLERLCRLMSSIIPPSVRSMGSIRRYEKPFEISRSGASSAPRERESKNLAQVIVRTDVQYRPSKFPNDRLRTVRRETKNVNVETRTHWRADGQTAGQPESSNYFIRSTIQDDLENRSASALTSKRRNNLQLVCKNWFTTSFLWLWKLTSDWPSSIESIFVVIQASLTLIRIATYLVQY